MQSTLLLISVLFMPLALASIQPNKQPTPNAEIMNNRYIIKLKQSSSPDSIRTFLNTYNSKTGELEARSNTIKRTYSKKFFNGISGEFSNEFINELRAAHSANIEYIEKDKIAHILAPVKSKSSQPNPPSWGLSRISQRTLEPKAPYLYPSTAGGGVDAWIVDTGCDPSRSDFGGRAIMAKSFVEGEEEVDLNGHGTHVAGTIGGTNHGVAKKVNVKCVKVLDANGSGSYSDVIAGVNFVTQNVRPGKTVMNMSLGGPKSKALDDAIAAAIKAGVVVVVAAGNEAQDACNVSPAGATGVLAVGATDKLDNFADFSNFGKCVGILAPGVDITSLWIGDEQTSTISGTSMASPHVAGVAALLIANRSFSNVNAVYTELKNISTANKVKKINRLTVNKLLYNGTV